MADDDAKTIPPEAKPGSPGNLSWHHSRHDPPAPWWTRGGANLRKDELRASSRARRAPRGLTRDRGSITVRPSEHPLTQSRSAARGGATFALLCMAFAAISLGRLRASTNTAAVFVAEVDDAIHPISAELMVSAIDRADTAGAAALVFVLRTPGGVLDSTRAIISRMIAARTPVIVYVAPSGARAASAGFLITIAADVAAMAPATHIGAAHPVSASGRGHRQDHGRQGGVRRRGVRPVAGAGPAAERLAR